MALAAGCAGRGGPSDEDLIIGQVEAWKAGLVAHDIAQIMAPFSEKFAHYETGDKAGLQDFMEGAIDMGYLDDVEVFHEEAEITIEDGVATVYPIDLSSSAGSVTIEFTLTKEDGGWMMTGMDIEGL